MPPRLLARRQLALQLLALRLLTLQLLALRLLALQLRLPALLTRSLRSVVTKLRAEWAAYQQRPPVSVSAATAAAPAAIPADASSVMLPLRLHADGGCFQLETSGVSGWHRSSCLGAGSLPEGQGVTVAAQSPLHAETPVTRAAANDPPDSGSVDFNCRPHKTLVSLSTAGAIARC